MTIPQVQTEPADGFAEEYRFPLSYPQLRLWYLEQLAPGDPAYHMPISLSLTGPLDVAALDHAFQRIVDRHEALRTAFAAGSGEPEQLVREGLRAATVLADFSGLEDPAGRAAQAARAVLRRPFDLAAAPLLRILLVRLAPQEHILLVALHHIACDGWSVGVLAAELSELYAAELAGREPDLPDLPVQYGDFALWQREFLTGDTLDRVLAHWEQALSGAPWALDLPTDRSRLLVGTSRAGHVRRTVPPERTTRIIRRAGEHAASLFMAVLAAYAAVLGRMAGADDLVIGTPAAGRARPEIRPLIGCFIDMLPIRLDLSGPPDAAGLLEHTRSRCLAAFAHQELPFERLVEQLRPPRDLPCTPLFQAMLTFQDFPAPELALPGLATGRPRVEQAAAKYEMTLNVEQQDGSLLLELEYNRDLFDADTADRVVDGVAAALDWLAAADGTPASAVAALPAPRRPAQDTVLIRGYRTAPDEIRQCLLQHPAVRECVVVSRGGALAAYVTGEPGRAPAAGRLVELLRDDLPDFVVPEATTELPALPRGADGTIDLSALPHGAQAPGTGRVRTAGTGPADETEAAVLACFRRALGDPDLGMADDYFEHGGSSLKAVRLVAEIERDLGVGLRMRQFVRAATPGGVAAAVRRETSQDIVTTLERDAALPADVIPAATHPHAWNPAHVLLTGATGFLGHALLERLLDEPGRVVTCLIRARDDTEAAVRLRAAARRFASGVASGGRVRPVAGDLTRPRLGLSAESYARLAQDVAAVYHCAAEVSFANPYPALRAANVAGTVEVIRFAAERCGKALHYVSTLSQAGPDGAAVTERIQPVTGYASTGYVATKRVGEALVAQAGERGLPFTILRPGLVTAHRRSGAMGEHDQLALGLRGALATGILPDLPDLPLHIMPVDEAADAIAALGACPGADSRVIHLYNPDLARLGDVADLLARLGHPVRPVPVEQWAAALAASDLPPAARLLVRLFAEAPGRSTPVVEARAATALLGRPVVFSALTSRYLQRAVAFILSSTDEGETI